MGLPSVAVCLEHYEKKCDWGSEVGHVGTVQYSAYSGSYLFF